MRLILVRHGETDWNRQHRIQGLGDLGLNEKGKKQAEALARALKNEKLSGIYASPLRRAQETARAIASFHQLEVVTFDGLKELDAGDLDGLTMDEMKNRHGKFLGEWLADASEVRLPGGSSLAELQDQVWAAIEDIMDRHRGEDENEKVAVVTHFFAILCIICRALGINLSDYRRLKVDVAAISALEVNSQRAVLTCLNDTCHLREVV
ncbi:histidine phosphatase family protein [Chloroflexota bacterium]